MIKNTEDRAVKLLKSKGLRLTGTRIEILQSFLECNCALSLRDLNSRMESKPERTTIYRTLVSFIDSGLIHEIAEENGSVKYGLCKEKSCGKGEHHHNHLHFKCEKCGSTFCIEASADLNIDLPKGFNLNAVSVSITGECESCSI